MKKSHRNIIVKLNRDYSSTLSQFCNEKNYSGLLFVNFESYDNLLYKNTNYVIAPVLKQLNHQDKIIVAPSVIENNTTLILEYGSLFVVHHILENECGEIEGLEPGYSIITLNFLYQLNEEIVIGKREPFWFELPPAKNLH